MQVAGCRLQVAGCRLQVAGCRLQVAGCRLQVAGCRLQVILVLRTYAIINMRTGYSYECISPKVLHEPPNILMRVFVFPFLS